MPDFLFDFGALDSDSRRGVGSLFRDHHTMFFVFSIFFFIYSSSSFCMFCMYSLDHDAV